MKFSRKQILAALDTWELGPPTARRPTTVICQVKRRDGTVLYDWAIAAQVRERMSFADPANPDFPYTVELLVT